MGEQQGAAVVTERDWLGEFEALVLSQKPATTPWTPCTDYSFEARKGIEGPHPRLIRETFQPQLVLDVGCGPDAHLVRLLREIDVQVHGLDVQPSTVPYTMRADITALSLMGWGSWDLVICREVLEHLTLLQIRRAVTNLCRLSSRYVYVTTRFHLAPSHLLDVMTSDDLDPTHITMLNQDFLRVLFVLEGFKRRAGMEEAMDWRRLGRVLVYERTERLETGPTSSCATGKTDR